MDLSLTNSWTGQTLLIGKPPEYEFCFVYMFVISGNKYSHLIDHISFLFQVAAGWVLKGKLIRGRLCDNWFFSSLQIVWWWEVSCYFGSQQQAVSHKLHHLLDKVTSNKLLKWVTFAEIQVCHRSESRLPFSPLSSKVFIIIWKKWYSWEKRQIMITLITLGGPCYQVSWQRDSNLIPASSKII